MPLDPGYSYVAAKPLYIGQIRAFSPGQEVPDSTVTAQGWVVGVDVTPVGTPVPSPQFVAVAGTPTDGQVPEWSASASKFVFATVGSGGGLSPANNLSDVGNPATALGNLGGAGLTGVNSFTKTNVFGGVNVPSQNYTGMAADFSGTVADTTGIGSVFSRMSAAITFTDGTNGTRGDAVSSVVANSTGSTQAAAWWMGLNFSGAGFVGKGSVMGYLVQGRLGPHGSGAYGEMGGVLAQIENNRPGGLAEAGELSVTVSQQSKTSALTLVVADNAGVASLAAYNWHRGLWLASGGSQRTGDAIYIEGAAGWTNYALFKDASGGQVFRMDSTGKMQIGASGHTLYDGGGVLQTDSVFEPAYLVITGTGYAQIPSTRWITNNRVGHYWGSGSPNGSQTADIGSTYGRIDGGAGTTLYVKESGTNTNTGWVAK